MRQCCRRLIWFWQVSLFCLVLVASQVQAENSWLKQGGDLLKSFGSETSQADGLPMTDIIAGLKQALEKGTSNVVSQLGAENGFNTDPSIRIPLPDHLKKVKSMLDAAGMGAYADDVELTLNRAAEAATPRAKSLFLDAISQMRFEDAREILDGPDDAATQYFRGKMTPDLTAAMTPVVEETLDQVGAVRAYDQMLGQYKQLPFVPDVKGDLTGHTVQKALDGIFYYLAKEEKAIRENPAKRTTELLERVFR